MTGLNRVRPLTGIRVGISVSESSDLERRGFTPAGLNRFAVRLSRALLAEGAVLAFGHDWRTDGVMDAVCGSAVESFGTPGVDVQPPLILNLIPWPDLPRTAVDALLRLEGILSIEAAELPPELTDMGPQAAGKPDLYRYLRSRGLTHLRRQLIARCDAWICVGGREHSYSGRYPGVFEEALFALEANRPTYLAGLLGGIADRLARGIFRGEPMPTEFGSTAVSPPEETALSISSLYATWKEKAPASDHTEDIWIDASAAWATACRLGAERIGHNGLTKEENLGLMDTTLEEESILLILQGLRRLFVLSTPGP